MRNTSIYDLVYKVIGEINPVGDSAIDAERKENLKEMIELVERLCLDLHGVSDGLFRHEASIREAGKLDSIKDKMKIHIAQFDLNGNFVQAFESISEGQRLLNNNSIFSMFHRGKNISKGYRFEKISKDCFLALAAMRDNNDYMQYFTNGHDFILCDREDWVDMYSVLCSGKSHRFQDVLDNYHKATKEEIIEHFKQ